MGSIVLLVFRKYPNHNNFDTYYLNMKFMILFLLLKMSISTTNCPKYEMKAQETSYFFKPITACLNLGKIKNKKNPENFKSFHSLKSILTKY